MSLETWNALMRRQIWYRNLLNERKAQWTDAKTLDAALTGQLDGLEKLMERIRRHDGRVERHEQRLLMLLPPAGTA